MQLKSDTILERKPDLKLCPNHYETTHTGRMVFVSSVHGYKGSQTAVGKHKKEGYSCITHKKKGGTQSHGS